MKNILAGNKEMTTNGKTLINIPFRHAPWHAAGIILCYILEAVYPAVFILVSGKLIDNVIAAFSVGVMKKETVEAAAALIALIGLRYLIQTINLLLKNSFVIQMGEHVNLWVLKQKASISYQKLESVEVQKLFKRIGDEPSERLVEGFYNVIQTADFVIRIAGIAVVLFLKVPVAAVLTLVAAVPLMFLSIKSGEQDYEADEKADAAMQKADDITDILSGRECLEEREVFQYTGWLDAKWREKEDEAICYGRKAAIMGIWHMNLGVFLVLATQLFVMLILLFPVLQGTLSAGIYISSLKSVNDFIQKVSLNLMQTLRNLKKSTLYARDIQKLSALTEEQEQEELLNRTKCADQIRADVEKIEICNLSFSYPQSEKQVICHMDMTLEKGKRYVIVGENGAGKSTFLKLLTGLYDEYEGEIKINGRKLSDMKQEEILSCFSILYQDFARYQLTVEENIKIGDVKKNTNVENSGENEIDELLFKVGLIEKVDTLSKKEKTFLGKLEEGSDLSGGQWQKLAIARCLYKNAPIYIMDEPTSAMDAVSEQAFADMFDAIDRDKIVLAITHRLGIARNADMIFVMKDGKVAESGTHSELMEKQKIYYRMYEAERSWYHD